MHDYWSDGTSGLTYDNIGQLTDADHAAGQADEDYAYDATGNRTNTGYQTGSNNRLLADGTSSYLYDDEGRRTRKTDLATGDYVESEWDHRGRLAAAVFRNPLGTLQKKITYEYDTDDRRIARHVDVDGDGDGDGDVDQSEHFVYAQGEVALVFSGAGSLTNRYLHGPDVDQVFADENAVGDVLWPLADHQHTVRDLAEYDSGTDTTTVANHRTFDSFGNVTAETNAAVDHLFAYTGREWDSDAELYNYRARWYEPAAGRFISEDPLGFDGGDVNLVRYVTNSPWNFTDPTGRISASPLVQTVAQIVAPTAMSFVNTVTDWSGALRNWSGGLNHAYDLAGGGNDIALQAAVAATESDSVIGNLWIQTKSLARDWYEGIPALVQNIYTDNGAGAAFAQTWQDTRVGPLADRLYQKTVNYSGGEVPTGLELEYQLGVAALGDFTGVHAAVEAISGYDQATLHELEGVDRIQRGLFATSAAASYTAAGLGAAGANPTLIGKTPAPLPAAGVQIVRTGEFGSIEILVGIPKNPYGVTTITTGTSSQLTSQALVGASGVLKGVPFVQVAGQGSAPRTFRPNSLPVPEGHTRVYRAVSEAEYQDIINIGRLRQGPNSLEGKWFAGSLEGAHAHATGNGITRGLFPDGNYRIIEVDIPNNAPSLDTRPNLDGHGPAFYLHNDDLPTLGPRPLE